MDIKKWVVFLYTKDTGKLENVFVGVAQTEKGICKKYKSLLKGYSADIKSVDETPCGKNLLRKG